MANRFSNRECTYKIDPVFNRSATLPDEANQVTGGMCTWVIGTQTASHNLDIQRYEMTNYKEYPQEGKPIIVIKCIGNATAPNTIPVRCDDGAGGFTTLYTFAADYSVTPRYIVVRLSATLGADGRRLWELA